MNITCSKGSISHQYCEQVSWVVQNKEVFSDHLQKNSGCLYSPKFPITYWPKAHLQFCAFPYVKKSGCYQQFHFLVTIGQTFPIRFQFHIDVKVNNGKKFSYQALVNCEVPDNKLLFSVPTQDIKSLDPSLQYATTFYCEIVPEYSSLKFVSSFGINETIKKLRVEATDTDVELICGERVFLAHKLILKARCPVFAAMFESSFIEGETDSAKVNGIEPDILNLLLDYIYGDSLVPSATILPQLLVAADMYSLDELSKQCQLEIAKSINDVNVLDVFDLADKLSLNDLKQTVISFISSKPLAEIMNKKYWEKFSKNIDVLEKILCEAASKLECSK